MKKIPVIIDTDPGVDDAVALIIALSSEKLDVLAVCSAAGNVEIDLTTNNALYLARTFGNGTVKVAKGVPSPSSRKLVTAADVHGKSGIGGFTVPELGHVPDSDDSCRTMYELISQSDEPVTVVTLAPLTNIAKLLSLHPDVKEKISVIYSMIASEDGSGNITPYAEFNAYCDPEALDFVVKSGVPMVFAPMQIGHETKLLQRDVLDFDPESDIAKMLRQIFSDYKETACGEEYLAMYDSNAVFPLICPEYYEFVPCDISVNITDRPGQTFLIANPAGRFRFLRPVDTKKLAEALLHEMGK